MREMTMKVLRPWKQHGGHPFPLLASQGGKSEDSHYHEGWGYRNTATFISNYYLPQWLPTRTTSHKHISRECFKSVTVHDFFLFSPSSFLSLFQKKYKKTKKQDRGCFKLRTLPSYQLARHTLYFWMTVKSSSQLTPLCLDLCKLLMFTLILRKAPPFPGSGKLIKVTQLQSSSLWLKWWSSPVCLGDAYGRRNNTLL